MFAALRNFFRRPDPAPPGTLTTAMLARRIEQLPMEKPPKGKRWCLGIDDQWGLVDIDKPRRRKAKSGKKRL